MQTNRERQGTDTVVHRTPKLNMQYVLLCHFLLIIDLYFPDLRNILMVNFFFFFSLFPYFGQSNKIKKKTAKT